MESASKALFNFSPLECTYLGKNSFQYHLRLVRKNEIEKWPLITSVQCRFAHVFCSLLPLRAEIAKNAK